MVGKRTKHSEDRFSFDHAFIPTRVSLEILQCNSTFCENLNIQGCEEEDRDLWDVAKDYDGFKYEHGLRVEKTEKYGEYEEYEYEYEEWEKSLLHNETFSFDLSSSIKLSVTETGVVWSWANFSHTHTVDILAKQFYPVFFLHGCQDKEESSSVKIINSEVGN